MLEDGTRFVPFPWLDIDREKNGVVYIRFLSYFLEVSVISFSLFVYC